MKRKYRSLPFGLLLSSLFIFAGYGISSSFELEWVSQYNCTANNADCSEDIAVDVWGNVYVTGCAMVTSSEFDIATIKYSPQGEEEWVTFFSGPGGNVDKGTEIEVDVNSNVFVAGRGYNSRSGMDIVLIKYNPLGCLEWSLMYDGTGGGQDYTSAMVLHPSGNICLTGRTYGGVTSYDFVTMMVNQQGQILWVAEYNGAANGVDEPSDLAVDCNGNIYVTGYSHEGGVDRDYVTVKYSSDGEEVWSEAYNGPDDLNDQASSLAIDNNGCIYVTGGSEYSETSTDVVTLKYDPDGNLEWFARYCGSCDESYDAASDLVVDEFQRVFLTGFTEAPSTSDNYLTLMYNPEGELQWERQYNGPLNSMDFAKLITLDSSGSIIVTGWSYGLESYPDFLTLVYDDNGDTQWAHRFNGSADGWDEPMAMCIDSQGRLLITGRGTWTGSGCDYTTLCYTNPTHTDPTGYTGLVSSCVGRVNQNPVSDPVSFSYLISPGIKGCLDIYSIDGRMMLQRDVFACSSEWSTIYLDGLPPGVYMYRISAESDQFTGKFAITE